MNGADLVRVTAEHLTASQHKVKLVRPVQHGLSGVCPICGGQYAQESRYGEKIHMFRCAHAHGWCEESVREHGKELVRVTYPMPWHKYMQDGADPHQADREEGPEPPQPHIPVQMHVNKNTDRFGKRYRYPMLDSFAAAEPVSDEDASDRLWRLAVQAAAAVDGKRFRVDSEPNSSGGNAKLSFVDTKHQFHVTRVEHGFEIGTSLGAPFNLDVRVGGYARLPETVKVFVEIVRIGTERRDRILELADTYRAQLVEITNKNFGRQLASKLAAQLNKVEHAVNDIRA
jgi:hypothetical protein